VVPSLTNFSSDLDESHNRSLGQVGGGRVPPVPPVATPLTVADILLIYRPQKDERLRWPGWLTYTYKFNLVLSVNVFDETELLR